MRFTGETYNAQDRRFYIERHGYGETVHFDISYSAIRERDGTIAGVLCIVSETTDRVRAANATAAERDTIWEVSQDLLGVADAQGVWLNINPAWSQALGWSRDEIVGRTSEWLEHPEDSAATRAEVARLGQGEPTVEFVNRFRRRDGSYATLSWRAVPVHDRLYCVARDVTREREAAAELEEIGERLRQAQKMETVGQLTGGIAHDFNNLLQIIIGNLETLQRSLGPEPARLQRAATNAMAGASRAAVLTQRLLAFARRQPLEPRSVDANRLLADMAELLHRTLGEEIAIETVGAPSLWRTEVDPNQLETALLNLAVNARDAMPRGGRLTIETANMHLDHGYAAANPEVKPGQYVTISVSDTGTGMDADTIGRAFEPFFTTKEVGRGTGLGLSMVYGFVKQSGGHVKIYSEEGQGTTIRVFLPRLIGGSDVAASVAPTVIPESTGAETILVCEDEPGVRALTTESLRELGYHVIEADSGPSALRVVDQKELGIALLFTDVVLPHGMTGAELAHAAQQIRPDLKVLFTTGYARNAIVHHGRLDPGVALITKPFSLAALATRIRDVLDG